MQALTRQFQQTETRNFRHLHAGTVVAQRIAQTIFHLALVAAAFHVDKVDHDQPTQVAQTHLAGDFFGSFQIGIQCGGFDVRAFGGAGGVDVNRGQGFGVVNHNRATGGQPHFAGMRGFDLMLDLEAREQWHVVFVALDVMHIVRHHRAHKGQRLLVNVFRVDQDFADFWVEVIADGAHHQTAFQINQRRGFLGLGCTFDGIPQLLQIVQIPLQLFLRATNPGSAGDDAHASGHFHVRQHFTQLSTFVAFDTTRHAAAIGIVRHQHDVAPSQTDVGGQRRALVAALVFFHLHQQLLTFFQRFADGGAMTGIGLVVLRGNFLERQKTVTATAIFDEAGFQTGFDARDNGLVDIAFALFLAGHFDV